MSDAWTIDSGVASTIIGCSTMTVYNLAKRGELPFHRTSPGGSYQFSRTDVLEYALDRFKTKAPSRKPKGVASKPTKPAVNPEERIRFMHGILSRVEVLEQRVEKLFPPAISAEKVSIDPPPSLVQAVDGDQEYMRSRDYLEKRLGTAPSREVSFVFGGYASRASRREGVPVTKPDGNGGVNHYREDMLVQAFADGEADGWKTNDLAIWPKRTV